MTSPLDGRAMNTSLPTREALLARVADIFSLLDETATKSEALRTLCSEAVNALHEAGLFGLWVPSERGGYDADLVTQIDVMIAVARADMSACWTMMIGNTATAMMATGLPNEGLEEVFSQECGPKRLPVAAGSLKPSGKARTVEGGYVASGKWGFGSGIHHASYIVANCRDAGSERSVGLVVPIAEVQIHDDWYVAGLCGSGSSSYSVSEVFVPERRVLTKTPRSGWRKSDPGPRLPIEHASVSLGGARRALDEVTEQAASKYRLLESQSVASKQSFQTELGRLEAEWESLYAGVRRLAKEMTGISQVDPAGLMPAAAKLRAVCAHATERSLAIGGRALRQAGAGAVASRNVLQRIHRDLTVSAQHAMISDSSYEDFGKELLGLDTSGKTTKGA